VAMQQHIIDGVPQLPAANDFFVAVADAFAKIYCHVYEPPFEVHFVHPEPTHLAAYAPVFQTRVRFGAPCNAIILPRARLDAPLARSNPTARAEYEKHAEEWLGRIRDSSGITVAVRRSLLANLRTGGATMETTARRLGLSVATLRRRLQDEGATYATILDAVRYDLAKKYLIEPGITTSDVAFLLGFQGASSFSKAFRRWNGGGNATQFRQRQRPRSGSLPR
jgi:AraC-like DNA-binding protein